MNVTLYNLKHCGRCGVAKAYTCSGCLFTAYCSRECQAVDATFHRGVCCDQMRVNMKFARDRAAKLVANSAFIAGMTAMSDHYGLNYICQIIPSHAQRVTCTMLEHFPDSADSVAGLDDRDFVFVELHAFDRVGDATVLITSGPGPDSHAVVSALVGTMASRFAIVSCIAVGLTFMITPSGVYEAGER